MTMEFPVLYLRISIRVPSTTAATMQPFQGEAEGSTSTKESLGMVRDTPASLVRRKIDPACFSATSMGAKTGSKGLRELPEGPSTMR